MIIIPVPLKKHNLISGYLSIFLSKNIKNKEEKRL